MKRKASAVWTGNLKQGQGALTTESKTLSDTRYSFSTRFEDGEGTNPEELIAAAHAGCFSMDLSARLDKAGLGPRRIDTEAALTLEKTDPGFTITTVQLTVRVDLAERDEDKFNEAVAQARAGCPVSKVLNATISVNATLV